MLVGKNRMPSTGVRASCSAYRDVLLELAACRQRLREVEAEILHLEQIELLMRTQSEQFDLRILRIAGLVPGQSPLD